MDLVIVVSVGVTDVVCFDIIWNLYFRLGSIVETFHLWRFSAFGADTDLGSYGDSTMILSNQGVMPGSQGSHTYNHS